MIELCYLCKDCLKRIGDMPVYTIPVVVPTRCDVCAEKDAVHVVNKRDLLWIMMAKIDRIERLFTARISARDILIRRLMKDLE